MTENRICSRCGADICTDCRFQNTLVCRECAANICDDCLKGRRGSFRCKISDVKEAK